jgi:hypothetical protein
MKKFFLMMLIAAFVFSTSALSAQCSICTKTASQIGEKAGKGLNLGIIYLALTPFTVAGLIAYRVTKQQKNLNKAKKD